MQITALIVTHHRSAWLERCIRSLRPPSHNALENSAQIDIRVLINGADAASRAVCEKLANEGYPLRSRERWTPLSPPEARNQLWASLAPTHYADDHWILFIDDDAYFDPEVAQNLALILKSVGQVDIVGGPNLTPPESPRFAHAVGLALASRFSTLLSVRRWRVAQERPSTEASLTLCNLCIRTTTLARHIQRTDILAAEAPFLPDFFYGEETRLIEQLRLQGARSLYTPKFWVWHERKRSLFLLTQQVFRSARGRARGQRSRLLERHGVHALPSLALVTLVAMVALAPQHLPAILLLYFGALAVSTLASFAHANSPRSLTTFALALTIPPFIHFSYALGYMVGSVRAKYYAN